MQLRRRYPCLILTIILVITNVASTSGDDEVKNDAAEEVSIEAVDVEDDPKLRPSVSSSFIGKVEKEQVSPVPSEKTEVRVPASDVSKAVAPIYPFLSGAINAAASSNLTPANSTVNVTTSRYLRVKVACAELPGRNSSLNESGTVEIVNMTHLLHGILVTNPTIKSRTIPSNCTVVLFYTHWCPWSAKAAPHYNALPRAFKNIRFAAIDSSVHTAINTYFGILSVPTVVLFYNGKILAKFNETTFNVNNFADFISTFTDQKPGIRLNVTSADFVGPIPSTITKGHDWYLYLSWTFIILVFIYYMTKTTFWHRVLELIQNSWREAEAVSSVPPPPPPDHHFHQD